MLCAQLCGRLRLGQYQYVILSAFSFLQRHLRHARRWRRHWDKVHAHTTAAQHGGQQLAGQRPRCVHLGGVLCMLSSGCSSKQPCFLIVLHVLRLSPACPFLCLVSVTHRQRGFCGAAWRGRSAPQGRSLQPRLHPCSWPLARRLGAAAAAASLVSWQWLRTQNCCWCGL